MTKCAKILQALVDLGALSADTAVKPAAIAKQAGSTPMAVTTAMDRMRFEALVRPGDQRGCWYVTERGRGRLNGD